MSGGKQGEKTIQQMLTAKKSQGDKSDKDKNKTNSGKPAKEPPYKRLASELSFNESVDLSTIQSDLESIKTGLQGVLRKSDLDNAVSSLVKKTDIENIVTTIVTNLIETIKNDLDNKYREKIEKQTRSIEELRQENEHLREMIASQNKNTFELTKRVEDNERRSKHAIEMSNYNEQYSRKFNIKVMQYPEQKEEDIRDIFINKIVKNKLNVTVEPNEVQAIHRIPGKPDQPNPIIVKLINSEVKSRVMRQKKNLDPLAGFKLVDDVTQHDMGLFKRLSESKNFDGVWYFNGAVYGKTKSGKRLKFNLFDDIEERLSKKDQREDPNM